ncbi:hypothetical protein SK128_013362, partial [Halocaridina rubra]
MRNGTYIYVNNSQIDDGATPTFTQEDVFKDEYFEPLLSLYKRRVSGELKTEKRSFKSGTMPKVLLWSKPLNRVFWNAQLVHINDGLCPLPCEVIFDEEKIASADAVIIYLRNAKSPKDVLESLSSRDFSQPWIMLTFEAPPLANSVHLTQYQTFDGFFNRTMMYRRDADIRVSHGFILNFKDAHILPSTWVVPHIKVPESGYRSLAVTFISNCLAKSDRLIYIDLLRQYMPVDIYGKCGDLVCGESMYVEHMYDSTQDPCLKLAGENYLFFLAFENAFCDDYVTEKLYNLLHYPIIPVVRGLADYSRLLPPNSYIDATRYTPKELAEKLLFLQTHPK